MNREQKANCRRLVASVVVTLVCTGAITRAEDGYRLWLRYDPLPRQTIEAYRPHLTALVVPGNSQTVAAIRTELTNGCSGLVAVNVPLASEIDRDGVLL